ncbi:MAG: protein kinase, partial [Solobacterium sp.]|nr:protein kinase [Solobacterium sp.]
HRDIKPENILVNAYGQYKLSDFGIAKTIDHVTKATLAGTPDYIAPEVFHKQAYGFLADEYSLGLVLYWALNERRMPFVEIKDRPPTDEEMQEAQKRRLEGEALPEPLNGNTLLKKAVLKACAYKPEDRYQTITEFKKALQLCDMAEIPEKEIPTEEIETEEDNFNSSETIGAWGRTEVKEETPVKEEAAEKTRLNKVAKLLREYSFSKNELLKDEWKTCITPYEAFQLGLGFALKANVIFTENHTGKAIQYSENNWTITFAEQGTEYVSMNIPKDIDTAIYWLTYAANLNEYKAMAVLSFIYEYDKKELQQAKQWMHKAYAQTNSTYYKEQLERQIKIEKGEYRIEVLKKYLPKLEGKSSFAPYPDLKTINTLRNGYNKPQFAGYEEYQSSKTEEILDNHEILAVYTSKLNWSSPRLVLVFTKEEMVSMSPLLSEKTADKNIVLYHLPYEKLRPLEIKNSGEIHMRDDSGKKYYLGYNPKNVDGQILFQLFDELSSYGKNSDLNLQMQIYLSETEDMLK